jgi:hypothetical protein
VVVDVAVRSSLNCIGSSMVTVAVAALPIDATMVATRPKITYFRALLIVFSCTVKMVPLPVAPGRRLNDLE